MKPILILTTVLVAVCMTVTRTASTPSSSEEFTDSDEEEPATRPCELSYCNDESPPADIDCNCDDQCWREQKCCLNYLNNNNVNRSTHYFGIPKAHIERGQLYQCHVVNPHKTSGFSVISKCGTPNETSTESWQLQKSLCEQPIRPGSDEDYLLRIPVSSYETGETYKNIYCAACHDDLRNIVSWNTSAVCIDDRVPNLTEAIHNLYVYGDDNKWPICELKIKRPSNIDPIQCAAKYVGYITQCPTSFLSQSTSPEDSDKRREIDWLCQATSNTLSVNGTLYENPYCAACHFNETDIGAVIQEKHGQCYAVVDGGIDDNPPKIVKSFPVLLDIYPFSNNENDVGVTNRCSSGYCYDPFTDECRSIISPTRHVHHQLDQHEWQEEMSTNVRTKDSLNDLPNQTSNEIKNEVIDLNCSTTLIKHSELFVNENGTLTVNQHKMYPKGTFQLSDNDTVYVCVDISDNYEFGFISDTHIYMTFICSSLSLIALFIKMFIFIVIPQIRKYPDRLVFCLCASLFIAQLLFLTTTTSSTVNYIACALIGVLTHYFFLSSFCWMNVLAYDMCNTFSTCAESRLVHSDILKRRFYCYSVYAWVTPMLIVSAACVFEWTGLVDESSIMRPHYGDLCWISRRTALLFYFAIPMALLLITNVVFFVLTAVSFCRSTIPSSMVQSTKEFQKQRRSPHYVRFSIYVKLAVIMGFTWISGFVAAFSGQQWLWHVFTLISASQGVYILIAFTPFKTMLQVVRDKFSSKRRSSWLSFLMSEV